MSGVVSRLLGAVRRRHATVIASLALLISLGGNAAAALIITSNGQVARSTISGHHPPSGDHANLIAGSVNGIDVANDSLTGADINESSLRGVAHKLYYYKAQSSDPNPPYTTVATVGPWTLRERCYVPSATPYPLANELAVNGPGEAQLGYSSSADDAAFSEGAGGDGLVQGQDTPIVGTGPRSGHFERRWGVIMLRSGSAVAELDFHMVSDYRAGLDHCFLYGSATFGA